MHLFKIKFLDWGHHLDLALQIITIFSNEELSDIIKIIKSLTDSGLLIKGVTKTVQNEIKQPKTGIFRYVNVYIMQEFIRKYVNRKRCVKTRQITDSRQRNN